MRQVIDLTKLKPDDFEKLLNDEFQVDVNVFGFSEDGSPAATEMYKAHDEINLKLVNVDRTATVSDGGREERFSLLFAGPEQPVLASGAHCLSHEVLGTMHIFVVQVMNHGVAGLDKSTLVYESVFS